MLIGYIIRSGDELLDVDLDVEHDDLGYYLDGIYLGDFPLHEILQHNVIAEISDLLPEILRDYDAEKRIDRFREE